MFDLELLPAAPPVSRAGGSPDPDPASGARIAADCRYAVSKLLGPWTRGGNNYQRDAIAQAAAVWSLEHPERLQDRPSWERRALLRDVCKGILRDTRDWKDSLDGEATLSVVAQRKTTETRDRERLAAIARGASIAEQASLYRAAERRDREPMFTSLDALADRDRDPETGRVEWDTVAADLAAETEAGEKLPASELAADTPELSERLAERIAERLQCSGIPLTGLQRDSVTVALMVAHGARLRDIGEDRGCSPATAKRRSADGMRILQTLPALGVDLVRERRSVIAAMLTEDRESFPADCSPVSVAEVDRLYSLAPYRDAIDTVARLKLSPAGETVKIRTGSPRDVLDYIARTEHALAVASSPAWTLDTADARPMPSLRERGERVLARATSRPLPVWQDPRVSLTGTVSGEHPASKLWPNDVIAGHATYRWPHKAIMRDVIARRAGETTYSTAAYAVLVGTDTDPDS